MNEEEKPENKPKKSEYQEKPGGLFKEGNPGGGRPKGSVSVVDAIKRKLQEIPKDKKRPYLEYLVDALFAKAIKGGDIQAMKDIINRVDGMPKQTIDSNVNDKREKPEEVADIEEEAVRVLDEIAEIEDREKAIAEDNNGATDKK